MQNHVTMLTKLIRYHVYLKYLLFEITLDVVHTVQRFVNNSNQEIVDLQVRSERLSLMALERLVSTIIA